MTRNPAAPDDEPEPEGGRAAERLRDHMMGRFPAGTFPVPGDGDEDSAADEAPEEAPPGPETETKKDTDG